MREMRFLPGHSQFESAVRQSPSQPPALIEVAEMFDN